MKYLLLLSIFINTLFSLEIDTKMFDKKESNSYLIEIEKKIQNNSKNSTKSEKIHKEEKYYLEKLKESLNKNIYINDIKLDKFSKQIINSQELLDFIKTLLELKNQENEQNELLINIQNKLAITRKQIENFLKKDKDKALLYQLQFAYFKVQKSNLEKKKNLLEKQFQDIFQKTLQAIDKIDENEQKELLDKINSNKIKIKTILQKKAELEIEYDKRKLEENKTALKEVAKKINTINKFFQEELIKTIDLNIRSILIYLKTAQKEKFFKLFDELEKDITKINEEDILEYKDLTNLLNDFAKKIFGNTKILLAKSSSQIENFVENAKRILKGTLFIFNEQAITLTSLLKALFLISFGFVLGMLYKRWLKRISGKWSNMSEMSLKISSNVGYYLIVFVTFMIAISSLGIDLSSLSLIAGALSIGIGFGLQTVVSNLIAGIILMFERTIRIGDVIEINEILKGTVSDIRIRSTTIKTFDNIDIVIPNSSFIQNNVINWTLEDPTRRLHISFGVAYGTKIEKVKEVVIKELLESDLTFIRSEDKKPEIRMEMMNASSVDLELLVWIKTNDKIKPNSLKSDFLILIYNTLYTYEIEIPFPQMDVHFNKKIST